MTSKFKCPVCQNNLHKINIVVSTCTNDKCKLWGLSIPNLVLETMTQTKQDLEIATKALKQIVCADKDGKPLKGVVSCWLDMDELNRCVEQIEHKE